MVATADVISPKGIIKKYSIFLTPVFDEQKVAQENALSSVWLPTVVPPLIAGLESLLMMGANAEISLPLKSNAPKGSYYKPPPPHILRQLQDENQYQESGFRSCGVDQKFELPQSFAAIRL